MPNDFMVQGPRMGRPGGRPDGFPGRPDGFPGRPDGFPGRPDGFPGRPGGFPGRPGGFPGRGRFPRRRFPPFFFPIVIPPFPRCFRYDRFGRCCDRFGWCCRQVRPLRMGMG